MADDELDEPAYSPREMSPAEQGLADRIYAAIQRRANYSERSQQSADFRIGISDLGWCSEKVRRMLAGQPEPVTDKLAAWVGTQLGVGMEEAMADLWPDAIVQSEVVVHLQGDTHRYTVSGHPDVVVPGGLVVDGKTDRGLGIVRRTGPNQQQQFQRHLYALGAWEKGMFGDLALEEVKVANVWLDRAADEHELHVHMEQFNHDVVREAVAWLDEVTYAFLVNEEARKEPPRAMCEAVCGHFSTCRAYDTDVQGLLTDERQLVAVDMYRQGLRLEKEGKMLKDQGRAALAGVSGTTGQFAVRWVQKAGGHVSFDRKPSESLSISRLK